MSRSRDDAVRAVGNEGVLDHARHAADTFVNRRHNSITWVQVACYTVPMDDANIFDLEMWEKKPDGTWKLAAKQTDISVDRNYPWAELMCNRPTLEAYRARVVRKSGPAMQTRLRVITSADKMEHDGQEDTGRDENGRRVTRG